jgi:serine protease Do
MIGTSLPSPRGYRLALTAAACLGLLLPAAARAQKKEDLTKNSPQVLAAYREVVAKARQSTVKVRCDGKDVALGTVVGAGGWVLTKSSELKGQTTTCQLGDGRELEATVVGVQDKFDLALLKIDAKGLPAVEWHDSKEAPVGSLVASAGTGADPIAVGVVSVGVRKGNPKEAVPSRDLSKSGYLGIALAPTDSAIKIEQVVPDTAADKAGLKANDLVLELEGKAYKDTQTFIDAVGDHKPGDIITLKIKRGEEVKEVKATLGKRPPSLSRGDIQNTMGGALSVRRLGFPSFLQHDTVLKPQECGGPVVDLDGKAIGINIARAGRVESYAIPSEAVQPLLLDLMSGKLAPKDKLTSKELTAEEKVAEAKAALQRAEAEARAAEKKVADAKAALEKAEAELKKAKEQASK